MFLLLLLRMFRNIHRHAVCRVTVATSPFVLFLLQLFYNCCTQTFAVYTDFLYLWHTFCIYCLLFGAHSDFVPVTRDGAGKGVLFVCALCMNVV